jgi:hypothetical protein
VPELAEQILSEPGWYALAATITDAEAAGHGPAALLTAAGRRELNTAQSVSHVLVWRLRRTAGLPADPSHADAGSHTAGRPANPATQHTQGRSGTRLGRP